MAWLTFWISGFSAWIGMLYVDHYHTNPVLVSFCHILIIGHREKRLQQAIRYWCQNQPTGKTPVWMYTGAGHQETSTLRLLWCPTWPLFCPFPLYSEPWETYLGDQDTFSPPSTWAPPLILEMNSVLLESSVPHLFDTTHIPGFRPNALQGGTQFCYHKLSCHQLLPSQGLPLPALLFCSAIYWEATH